MQQTLSIIKPDAAQKNQIGNILARFEKSGLKIIAMRMVRLSKKETEDFYSIHRGKGFFEELTTFMASGPVVVSVLEGENAVEVNRKIMGHTDPKKADKGTIRADFATDIGQNAVHGSDSIENAKKEIDFFFKQRDLTH